LEVNPATPSSVMDLATATSNISPGTSKWAVMQTWWLYFLSFAAEPILHQQQKER
jgi:hypothetical protein